MSARVDQVVKKAGIASVVAVVKPGETRHLCDNARPVLDLFADPTAQTAAGSGRDPAARTGQSGSRDARYFKNLGVAVGVVDASCCKKLERHRAVEEVHAVEPLAVVRPVATRAVSHRSAMTWGLRRLQVPSLWDEGLDGANVKVGHLDTGIDGKHPALKRQLHGFAEFDLQGKIVPGSKPHDSASHGTHTAGTLCGSTVDDRSIGIAPGVRLFSGLVVHGDNAQLLPLLAGLEWMLRKKVRVLNVSVGFRRYTSYFEKIVATLRRKGTLPVFAIGNDGPGRSRSPGNYPEPISVGSIGIRNLVSAFSSSQRFARPIEPDQPNVVAPGEKVISAKPGGGVQAMDGTSMAAPHVAGVAALLLQAVPGATVDDLELAIQSTCWRFPDQPALRYGHGLINPPEALDLLRHG